MEITVPEILARALIVQLCCEARCGLLDWTLMGNGFHLHWLPLVTFNKCGSLHHKSQNKKSNGRVLCARVRNWVLKRRYWYAACFVITAEVVMMLRGITPVYTRSLVRVHTCSHTSTVSKSLWQLWPRPLISKAITAWVWPSLSSPPLPKDSKPEGVWRMELSPPLPSHLLFTMQMYCEVPIQRVLGVGMVTYSEYGSVTGITAGQIGFSQMLTAQLLCPGEKAKGQD